MSVICSKCGRENSGEFQFCCMCGAELGVYARPAGCATLGPVAAKGGLPANERQVGGKHYRSAIQHWDYVLANKIPYLEAQVIKYVTRWRDKGGLQDLEKAKHFLEKLIEHESST